MLGFSLQKLLVLVGIVMAVWYGFKVVGRLQAERRADERLKSGGASRSAPTGRARGESRKPRAKEKADTVEDMVECPQCGTYVSRAAGRCERSDCPY